MSEEMTNEELKAATTPIPVTGETLDLQKVLEELPEEIREKVKVDDGRISIPLADAIKLYGFCGCVVCSCGGHTGDTLYTVITDLAKRTEGKACKQHVGQFIRPKDLKKNR